MLRVGLFLRSKDYLSLMDAYRLALYQKKIIESIANKKYLSAYFYLKEVVRIFTGRRFVFFFDVLRLKRFFVLHNLAGGQSSAEKSINDVIEGLKETISFFSVKLKTPPDIFASGVPLDFLKPLKAEIVKEDVMYYKNMLMSYHAPEAMMNYLTELAELAHSSENDIDRIKKAIERSPNINRKREPHWADASAFISASRLKQ